MMKKDESILKFDNTRSEVKRAIKDSGLENDFLAMPIEVLEAYGIEVMKEYEKILGRKFIYAERGCCYG